MSSRFLVRIRGRILIDDLVEETGLDERVILDDLKQILRTSSSAFGVKAFRIEFDGHRGWSILPSSCVGLLAGEVLTLVLESRLLNLQTEKVIALAQLVGPDVFRISTESVRAGISNSDEFGTTDLLGISLVDACSEIRRTGRDFKYVPTQSRSFNIRGSIDFAESLQTGSVRPPISNYDSVSYSTDANVFIYSALIKAREATRVDAVLQAVSQELLFWSQDMDPLDDVPKLSEISNFSSSYPRSDYGRAITLAIAIHLDLSIDVDGSNTSIPQVLADLDLLFEQYCTIQLRKLLPDSVYSVQDQVELPHPSQPALSGYIKPDLIITNKQTGRVIVIDLKNKYSQIQANQKPSLSNADIYQISYYALAIESKRAMLVYPTTENLASFPIKKSESSVKYAARIEKFRSLHVASEPVIKLGKNEITLTPYQVDLGGTMANTAESLASLALYIDYLLSEDQI